MGLFILEILVKMFTGIICAVLLLIAIIIAGVVSLIDGIRYGYWHRDNWAALSGLLKELVDDFRSPIFN